MDAVTDQRSGADQALAEDRATGVSRAIHRGPPAPPRWLQRHVHLVMLSDGLAATLATLASHLWAFGLGPASLEVHSVQIPYSVAPLIAVPAWLVVLATSRCYDTGPFGFVEHETRRVVRAGAHFLALIAVAYYIVNMERLGREFLGAIVPLAVLATLVGRALARSRLRHQRHGGHAMRRTLLVGPRDSVESIVQHVAIHPGDGIAPVAALAPGSREPIRRGGTEIPVVGSPGDLTSRLASTGADVLVIAGDLAPGQLRRLTWDLEGTGVDVLVAPAAAHLAGPLLDVRPIAGLPLLYVDHSSFPTEPA